MRKIVLVYLLMIALPAVLVALGGLHLVRREVLRLRQDEQAHAAQAGMRLVARAQKELLETARKGRIKLQATEQVMIIDSLVLPKTEVLNAIKISSAFAGTRSNTKPAS